MTTGIDRHGIHSSEVEETLTAADTAALAAIRRGLAEKTAAAERWQLLMGDINFDHVTTESE